MDNIDNIIKVGDACGEWSYLGDLALKNGWKYCTWIREEPERNFVAQWLWEGAIDCVMHKCFVPLKRLLVFEHTVRTSETTKAWEVCSSWYSSRDQPDSEGETSEFFLLFLFIYYFFFLLRTL
jgi:hypothetical protein